MSRAKGAKALAASAPQFMAKLASLTVEQIESANAAAAAGVRDRAAAGLTYKPGCGHAMGFACACALVAAIKGTPNCAGLTCQGCEDPHCLWYAAQMSGRGDAPDEPALGATLAARELAAAMAPIALDVLTIARALYNARPSDYLTNTAARNAWYASVAALSDTLEAMHPGTDLSEFFDVAGVPS
jgi:hypothetical protein